MAAEDLTQVADGEVERITSDDLTSHHVGKYIALFGDNDGRRSFVAGVLLALTHRVDAQRAFVTGATIESIANTEITAVLVRDEVAVSRDIDALILYAASTIAHEAAGG